MRTVSAVVIINRLPLDNMMDEPAIWLSMILIDSLSVVLVIFFCVIEFNRLRNEP